MELGIDSPDDWNIKYRDTVAMLDGGPVYLSRMLDDGDIDLYTASGNGWSPKRVNISDVELDHTVPPCGLINFKSTVIDVYRTGVKQYRRGFTFNNHAFEHRTMMENYHRRIFKSNIEQDVPMIESIFNPVYYTPQGALNEILAKERIAAAITNRYYFAVSPYVPYIHLGYDKYIIGRVNENTAECTLFRSAAPLAQDVSQYIQLK